MLIMRKRGLNKGSVYDPGTGSVSVIGGILLACGLGVGVLSDDAFPDDIPSMQRVPALMVWEYIDAEVDGLEEWEDCPTTRTCDAVRVLGQAADFYAIVIQR